MPSSSAYGTSRTWHLHVGPGSRRGFIGAATTVPPDREPGHPHTPPAGEEEASQRARGSREF